jgi:phosphate/sulfate permease
MLIGSSHALLARSRGESTSTMTLGWMLAGVGLALVLWRGTDVVVIAWIIAVAALVIAAALLYVASRLRFLQAASGGT